MSLSFAALYVGFVDAGVVEATHAALLFLALPVALCGIAFGLRGGLTMVGASSALVWWGSGLSPFGVVMSSIVLAFLGGVVGVFADERRRMIAAASRRDELALDLIATVSADGWYLSVNPAFTNLLGFSANELTGRPFVDFVHPDDRARTLADLAEQVGTGGDVVNAVNRHRTKAGGYRWLEWTSRVDEETGTLVSFARDVTERVQAEEREQLKARELEVALEDARGSNVRLNLVAEAVTDGLITIDESGTIVRFNTSSERIFGYRRDEVVGRSAQIVMADTGHEGLLARYLRTGEDGVIGVRRELRGRRKNGSNFPLECTVGEVSHRGERLFIAVVRDITEQKRWDEAEQDYKTFLQQTVGERSAQLQQLARELDDARLETLSKLALAAEYRDDQTFAHAARVGNTAAQLGELLGLTPLEVARLRQAAPLHDIGKLAVSDTILLKCGKLTPEQWHQMRTHTTVGHEILSGSTSDVLSLAAEIAL
ncbi:PAS domain S-box protein, partial [Gaiella sp.]|uniref:PAS domain S-box protein n=1 Tax=Gaiella sp. TaxID=2663207 RepID=UPI0039838762